MRAAVRKNAERNAGILAVDQVNEIVNKFVTPAFGGPGLDCGFGQAVEKDDDQSEDQPAQAGRVNHRRRRAEEVKEASD